MGDIGLRLFWCYLVDFFYKELGGHRASIYGVVK